MVYVYEIRNLATGKIYIGVSSDPEGRFFAHTHQKKNFTKLGRAIKKYGKENFRLRILSKHLERDSAYREEIRLIASMNLMVKGYNASPGGDGYLGKRTRRKRVWRPRRDSNPRPTA